MSTETIQLPDFEAIAKETEILLKNRPTWMSYNRIEKDTGIKQSWLNAFSRSVPPSRPGIKKLVLLYNYLKDVKAKVEAETEVAS